ncbi:MAG TPA: hypothetical protein VM509_13475 [Planctomycetota bacterium]|nr:hypothetical protein [Planctomycetota bacterium]
MTVARRAAIRASFAVLLLAACRDSAADRAWPAGTVVAVDDVPVTAAEVAQDMLALILISPESGELQLKRLAFNEIALPRAVLRTRVTEAERDAARLALDARFEKVTQGSSDSPSDRLGVLGREASGNWGELGLVAWGAAMNLPVGEWSEVVEEPGAFLRLRLLERKEGPIPAATVLRIDRVEAVYAAHEKKKQPLNDEAELKLHRLTIVDPAWDTIVPERTKYLMGVHEQ